MHETCYRIGSVCSLGSEHGTDETYRLQTFFSKALQALQRLLVPYNVDLALEPVAKRMSTIREAIIVKTTEREYVNQFCQSACRPPRSRVIVLMATKEAGEIGGEVRLGGSIVTVECASVSLVIFAGGRGYKTRLVRMRSSRLGMCIAMCFGGGGRLKRICRSRRHGFNQPLGRA